MLPGWLHTCMRIRLHTHVCIMSSMCSCASHTSKYMATPRIAEVNLSVGLPPTRITMCHVWHTRFDFASYFLFSSWRKQHTAWKRSPKLDAPSPRRYLGASVKQWMSTLSEHGTLAPVPITIKLMCRNKLARTWCTWCVLVSSCVYAYKKDIGRDDKAGTWRAADVDMRCFNCRISFISAATCTHVYMVVCSNAVYVYIYIYIYKYTYIHTHTQTHTHICKRTHRCMCEKSCMICATDIDVHGASTSPTFWISTSHAWT